MSDYLREIVKFSDKKKLISLILEDKECLDLIYEECPWKDDCINAEIELGGVRRSVP